MALFFPAALYSSSSHFLVAEMLTMLLLQVTRRATRSCRPPWSPRASRRAARCSTTHTTAPSPRSSTPCPRTRWVSVTSWSWTATSGTFHAWLRTSTQATNYDEAHVRSLYSIFCFADPQFNGSVQKCWKLLFSLLNALMLKCQKLTTNLLYPSCSGGWFYFAHMLHFCKVCALLILCDVQEIPKNPIFTPIWCFRHLKPSQLSLTR